MFYWIKTLALSFYSGSKVSPVAQYFKRWPADIMVTGSRFAGGGSPRISKRDPLHAAFQSHSPDMTELKDVTSSEHSFIYPIVHPSIQPFDLTAFIHPIKGLQGLV